MWREVQLLGSADQASLESEYKLYGRTWKSFYTLTLQLDVKLSKVLFPRLQKDPLTFFIEVFNNLSPDLPFDAVSVLNS